MHKTIINYVWYPMQHYRFIPQISHRGEKSAISFSVYMIIVHLQRSCFPTAISAAVWRSHQRSSTIHESAWWTVWPSWCWISWTCSGLLCGRCGSRLCPVRTLWSRPWVDLDHRPAWDTVYGKGVQRIIELFFTNNFTKNKCISVTTMDCVNLNESMKYRTQNSYGMYNT